jgi:3,8-divinyl chlorophyllide a/chlorophyllide a reductase subunit Z
VQEVCNALFDALFHILPLANDLDRVEATPASSAVRGAQPHVELAWDVEAQALLAQWVEAQPVLVRISAAKRMRDRAEQDARSAGESRVTPMRVQRSLAALQTGVPA